MKTLFDSVSELDNLHRQLQKMESKMRSGQWIDAWKEVMRLMAVIEKEKSNLIKRETENEE